MLFGLPGAFTGTCSTQHLPSFIRVADALRAKGVDEIVCVAVNDPHVMLAWGEATGATAAGIRMLADAARRSPRRSGSTFDNPAAGLFPRSKRYALLAEDGVVRVLNLETEPTAMRDQRRRDAARGRSELRPPRAQHREHRVGDDALGLGDAARRRPRAGAAAPRPSGSRRRRRAAARAAPGDRALGDAPVDQPGDEAERPGVGLVERGAGLGRDPGEEVGALDVLDQPGVHPVARSGGASRRATTSRSTASNGRSASSSSRAR